MSFFLRAEIPLVSAVAPSSSAPATTAAGRTRSAETAAVSQDETVLMYWAPEVEFPQSHVHYVQVRTTAGDGPSPSYLFRRVSVNSFSTHRGRNTTVIPLSGDTFEGPCHLQHAASGLFVTASLSPRGLLWLDAHVERAAVVRLIKKCSLGGNKRGDRGAFAKYYVTLANRSNHATGTQWLACVYSPQEVVNPVHDLGVNTRDRKSLVLNSIGVRRKTTEALPQLRGDGLVFELLPEDICRPTPSTKVLPIATDVADVKKPQRVRVRRPQPRKRSRPASTSSDSSSVSESDDASAATSSESTSSSSSRRSASPTRSSPETSEDEEVMDRARAAGDAFTLVARRRMLCNYFQDKCIGRNKDRVVCTKPGADRYTVIGFGATDPIVRNALRLMSVGNAETANCMACSLRAGVPLSDSSCRIPVILTTRRVAVGEPFVLLDETAPHLCDAADDYAMYMETLERLTKTKNECKTEVSDASGKHPVKMEQAETKPPPRQRALCASSGSHENESAVAPWNLNALYYYGNHRSLAVPASSAILEFPFTCLAVRACRRLRGEKEVVASHFVPKGTCFLYCGPPLHQRLKKPALRGTGTQRQELLVDDDDDEDDSAQSTAMMVDRDGRKRIEGGNIMRFVNHFFGFAAEGNVAFRRGAVMYRNGQKPSGRYGVREKEVHIVFFVATKDIAAGELLLAESYGPEYDSFIERIALCGGSFLSVEERAAIAAARGSHSDGLAPSRSHGISEWSSTTALPPGYLGCYQDDIRVGSIVGKRELERPTARKAVTSVSTVMKFYVVTAEKDNVVIVELLDFHYPLLRRRSDADSEANVGIAALRKTEVILFIPGWDYRNAFDELGQPCLSLTVTQEALSRTVVLPRSSVGDK